jgi:hypothetical protein
MQLALAHPPGQRPSGAVRGHEAPA